MLLPALLYLLALVLRAAWVLAVPSKPVGDFAMYLESATHLLSHGRFDEQFIYMPGYVLLAAAVQALGGGWLAIKLVGAGLAATGSPLLFGITRRLWDRRAAAVAGVLYAIWPGGVAVSSVTGTDVPAAVLITAGAYALVRATGDRPYPAALISGALLGLAAWVRAVAVPLAPLGVFLLWARTRSFRRAVVAAALATAAAIVTLSPWGLRNHARYGQFFLTDSHGGLTALVGAYPNSDGQFTRALNRTYETVTGTPWLHEPHREADARAYGEAKRWTRFEPRFALGLALQRADKLLSNERSLLYWPLYRQGVLPSEQSQAFERWRHEIETVTDAFWWFLLLSCLAAIPLCVRERRWEALGLLPMQAALVAVYVLFFAESRYHLPIAALAFPSAAGFSVHVLDAIAALRESRKKWVMWRSVSISAVTLVVVVLVWQAGQAWGVSLRERHRWAVAVCRADGEFRYCLWKREDGRPTTTSPVRGVYDGVGLDVRAHPSAAVLELQLAGGQYRMTGALLMVTAQAAPASTPQGAIGIEVNGEQRLSVSLVELSSSQPGSDGRRVSAEFAVPRGTSRIRLMVEGGPSVSGPQHRVWLQSLELERVPARGGTETPQAP